MQIDVATVDEYRSWYAQTVAALTDGDQGIGDTLRQALAADQASADAFAGQALEVQKLLDKTDMVSHDVSMTMTS